MAPGRNNSYTIALKTFGELTAAMSEGQASGMARQRDFAFAIREPEMKRDTRQAAS